MCVTPNGASASTTAFTTAGGDPTVADQIAIALSAPMSSTTESDSRKTRSWIGQFRPKMARAPSRKAVSVAIGTPPPLAPAPPALNAR